MTELEALAKDCIENHTHRLIDKPTKQDIYLREESIFIQGYRQSEKRIAEFEDKLANVDYQLEGRDLEIADLEKENAELKELIKNIIRVTWGEGWNYSLDWKVKAEQFLKDCDIDNAIQQANKGLDFDKIADEMEQDLKDSEIEK